MQLELDPQTSRRICRRSIRALVSLTGVWDRMKTKFLALSPSADLFGEGYGLLQESELRALPVVERGRLVGMLTIEDIGHAGLLRQPTTRR